MTFSITNFTQLRQLTISTKKKKKIYIYMKPRYIALFSSHKSNLDSSPRPLIPRTMRIIDTYPWNNPLKNGTLETWNRACTPYRSSCNLVSLIWPANQSRFNVTYGQIRNEHTVETDGVGVLIFHPVPHGYSSSFVQTRTRTWPACIYFIRPSYVGNEHCVACNSSPACSIALGIFAFRGCLWMNL